MSKIGTTLLSSILNGIISHVEKDPEHNLNRLLNLVAHFATLPNHKQHIRNFKTVLTTKNHWYHLIIKGFKELHPNVHRKLIQNLAIHSVMTGNAKAEKLSTQNDISVPWAILMDPTTVCNLKCKGCWAAEYKKNQTLDFETLDRIIREGKELGIFTYIYSGGEPLMRKHDLVKLAHVHNDCVFLAFTNATLIDESFATTVSEAGNFALALSIEGFEDETDMRRGKGTYQKVIRGMDILKKSGAPFGFSACYHRKNIESVGSDEFLDFMVEKGCFFGWYFTYIPLGTDALPDLITTAEQREEMYHRVRNSRSHRPLFLMDFWNDGEYIDGCIAGGRKYLHINANGDVEPCAFIHYSNCNIHDVSLFEALKSPLFREYRRNQPFNANHLRPCPLLDNPEKLRMMVHASEARSTQPIDQESVDTLTAKCDHAAREWAVRAEALWGNGETVKSAVCHGKKLF